MLGTSDAWSRSHLSQRTSEPVHYIVDCRISSSLLELSSLDTWAIIIRGLYILYPIFYCGLYCRAVSISNNFCTKQGNSLSLSGFKSKTGYMASVR